MSKQVVHEIQSFEEFFGLDNRVLESSEWVCTHENDKVAYMVNRVLVIMQEFYREHMYDTPSEWKNLDHQIRELNDELYNELRKIFMDYTDELEEEQDRLWFIPTGTVDVDITFDPILSAGIDGVTNTLYDDIKEKALFYDGMIITSGIFSVYSNFRRAIRQLTNLVDFNAQYGEKAVERVYLEFVYGEDALFDWITSGRNTCEWCYYIESLNPQPLSALPVDHINGGCSIVPHNPNEYSDEYKLIRGLL